MSVISGEIPSTQGEINLRLSLFDADTYHCREVFVDEHKDA